MSDTEIMPISQEIVASGNSLTRFRYAFTSINVFNRPNGRRLIEVNDDGRVVTFDLPAEAATHFASLLIEGSAS